MSRQKRVVVIEGEDAAPEAMRPSVALLQGMGLPIEWVYPPVGLAALERHGSLFPDEARAAIDASDTTLFGATSGPSGAAVSYLRWGKQTYANVRPARWMAGCRSPLRRPEEVDFVIVRENLEDMYVRIEGDLGELAPLEFRSPTARRGLNEMGPGRYALKVITEERTAAVTRFACELARRRREGGHAGKVTVGTKHNMLPGSDGYFLEVARTVAGEFPDVVFEAFIIDDFARRLIAEPGALDVVLLPNLYGDVLSDAAAGLIGGLGLAPSGCYGDTYAYFESAHGSAPDIAGRHVINPTATLLSAAMMLEYLGLGEAAARLRRAIESVYAEGRTLTPDQGGNATTEAFCEAVGALL
jgi:isocitrate/isopropylmalate dehydrogenase